MSSSAIHNKEGELTPAPVVIQISLGPLMKLVVFIMTSKNHSLN